VKHICRRHLSLCLRKVLRNLMNFFAMSSLILKLQGQQGSTKAIHFPDGQIEIQDTFADKRHVASIRE